MDGREKDLSWYVKWVASIILLTGMAVRALDIEGDYRAVDQFLNLMGVLGWLIVGLLWWDRSIIITQVAGSLMLLYFLLQTIEVI